MCNLNCLLVQCKIVDVITT